MYKLNNTTIDGDILIANVTIFLTDKNELVVNVPVKFPRTKEAVIFAIEQRVKAEKLKFATEPILTTVKNDLDVAIGKVQTIAVVK